MAPSTVSFKPTSMAGPDATGGAAAYPDWTLLNKTGLISDQRIETTAECRTPEGQPLAITFWLADPPAVSQFTVYCPDLETDGSPFVLCAEDAFVLFRVSLEDRSLHHFVYSAAGVGKNPSLHLLPDPNPNVASFRTQEQLGLLPCGDEHYAVAFLDWKWRETHDNTRQYYVHVFSSETNAWRRSKAAPLKLSDSDQALFDTYAHGNHKQITVGESAVGWVYLTCGILLACSLFDETPGMKLIPLPASRQSLMSWDFSQEEDGEEENLVNKQEDDDDKEDLVKKDDRDNDDDDDDDDDDEDPVLGEEEEGQAMRALFHHRTNAAADMSNQVDNHDESPTADDTVKTDDDDDDDSQDGYSMQGNWYRRYWCDESLMSWDFSQEEDEEEEESVKNKDDDYDKEDLVKKDDDYDDEEEQDPVIGEEEEEEQGQAMRALFRHRTNGVDMGNQLDNHDESLETWLLGFDLDNSEHQQRKKKQRKRTRTSRRKKKRAQARAADHEKELLDLLRFVCCILIAIIVSASIMAFPR